jgi:hypothetical protein
MKKISLLLILVVLMMAATTHAQQPASPAQPLDDKASGKAAPAQSARVDVAPEAQQAIVAGQANLRAAQATLDAAQLRLENLILKLRLLLKVPDDFDLRVDERGNFYFEKPAVTQVGSEKPPKK